MNSKFPTPIGEKMELRIQSVAGKSPTGEVYPLLGGWHWIDGKVYCRGETYLGTCTGEEIVVDNIRYKEVRVPEDWSVWPN
jgi:hypothetical protein